MSKSLNFILPLALGGTALAIAGAYGFASRGYKQDVIASLEVQVQQAVARAERAAGQVAAADERTASLEAEIATVQAVAAERLAMGVDMTKPAPEIDGRLGIGRAALTEEIAAWDVDVLPDGRGLPPGQGDVWFGEEVFVEKCGSCHGDFAEGVDNWPVLAGGLDTLANEDPVKTVGSYWPHLSTAWDYINRSMPFGEAGTLSADETYAIVAYILYSNDLVDDDFVLSQENFAEFDMYNMNGFVIDDRAELEYSAWRAEPCMANCKEEVTVTMRSVFLVETPPEGGSNSVMNHRSLDNVPSFTSSGASFIPEAEAPQMVAEEAVAETEAVADTDALIAAGERLFRKCSSCHQVGPNAKNRSGPHLNGIMGRTFGSVDGFRYSNAFKAAFAEGRVWDAESLASFLVKPRSYISGTKMSFAGFKSDDDIAAITAYLGTLAE